MFRPNGHVVLRVHEKSLAVLQRNIGVRPDHRTIISRTFDGQSAIAAFASQRIDDFTSNLRIIIAIPSFDKR
jgi:hypothetical protein